MVKRIIGYGLVPFLTGAATAFGAGPFHCWTYGCSGGSNFTLHTMLVAGAVGVVGGVVLIAVIDIAMNGPYLLANRAEAKARRQRAEALRKTGGKSD
jgi:hypothetical protein